MQYGLWQLEVELWFLEAMIAMFGFGISSPVNVNMYCADIHRKVRSNVL